MRLAAPLCRRPRRARAATRCATPSARPRAAASRTRADRQRRRAANAACAAAMNCLPAAQRAARPQLGRRERVAAGRGPVHNNAATSASELRARELARVAAAVVDALVGDQRDLRLENRQPPVQRLLGRLLGIAPLARARDEPLEVVARVARAAGAAGHRFGADAAAADVGVERRAADAEQRYRFVGIDPGAFSLSLAILLLSC